MPEFTANAYLATSDGRSNGESEPGVSCTSVFKCKFLYQDFLPNFKAPESIIGTKQLKGKEVQFEPLHYIFQNMR